MTDRFIAICGPTASGKTAISIALARTLNAEILSFDASQAFREADIGTAKVEPHQKLEVPHHLLDLLDCNQQLEAGFFVSEAEGIYSDIILRNRTPLLCVGTNMYLALFLEGLANTGSGDPKVRKILEAEASDQLYAKLQDLDPERAAALHPNDRLRVIRALEICSITGRTVSDLYSEQVRALRHNGLIIVLCWKREALAQRIELRVNEMFKAGLLTECQKLLERFGDQSQIFDSIGYSETLEFLRGDITEQELRILIATHTKQLAKKQMTFLRRFPLKHALDCFPPQDYSKEAGKKDQVFEFKCLQIGLSELIQECKKSLSEPKSEAQSRVVYVDAEHLLQTLAVTQFGGV